MRSRHGFCPLFAIGGARGAFEYFDYRPLEK